MYTLVENLYQVYSYRIADTPVLSISGTVATTYLVYVRPGGGSIKISQLDNLKAGTSLRVAALVLLYPLPY